MNNRKNRKAVCYAALIFVAVLIIYTMWPPRAHDGDDLQYAMVINQAVIGDMFYHPAGYYFYDPQSGGVQVASRASDGLINPRYIFEWPTSIMVAKLWRLLGWRGDVITPILTLRVLVGALGVIFFFLAIQTLCNNALIAGISSIGLATSHTYWIYGTRIDYTINMTALICLAFYLLVLRYRSDNPARSNFLLLVVLVVATFYSWIAGMTALVFALAVASWYPDEKIGGKIKRFVRFCAIYGVLVAVVIALVIAVWDSPSSLISLDYWRPVCKVGRLGYNVNVFNDALRAVLGFAKAQIPYPGEPGSFRGFHGLIFLLMSTPFWVLLLRRRQLQRRTWVWAILMVAWIISYGLFIWFWIPHEKYYPVPLIGWWAIVALTLEHLKLSRRAWYRLAIVFVLIFIALTFFVNLKMKFSSPRDEQSHEWLSIAQSLRQSEPNVLFVSFVSTRSVGHPLDFHIAYFTRRNVVSVDLVSWDNGGDERIARQVVTAHIERHRSVGGAIYVYGFDSLPADERNEFLGMLDGQQLKTAWSFPQLTIYEVMPEPGEHQ